jgi:IS5 family transposase
MRQTSFASLEYAGKKRVTRREKFLAQMQQVVPWARLLALIEPHYPRSGRVGRPPVGLERMLRMYFLQQWFALSDEALEDALYDSHSMREFVGIDLAREAVPDATTLLKFRRLLEAHALTAQLFEAINAHLAEQGLLLREGTMVDASIIAAPSSTKNKDKTRDPQMHQTKKGNQWHFGMKAHIGVDADLGLVHTVVGTAANVNDVTQAHALLHGEETDVFADAGYQGVSKRQETQDIGVNWHVAMRPGKRKVLDKSTPMGAILDQLEQAKARIRAKVEHPFRVIKRQFGHMKVRYRGLAKNTAQLHTLFALSNLWMVRRTLLQEMRG